MKHGWGAQAVLLGAWETAAFLGVVPPASRAYAAVRGRWRLPADLALVAWLLLLRRHLRGYAT